MEVTTKEGLSRRYLITSADERTWKFDRPVLFLGNWCLLHHRKQIWSGMDAIVADPYGMEQSQKENDYKKVLELEKDFLPILSRIMNNYHQTSYSERFWQIVMGNWLRKCISTVFNRVQTAQQCIRNYQLSGTTVFSEANYSLAVKDSHSGSWAVNDDQWNSIVYGKIFSILGGLTFEPEIIETVGADMYEWPYSPAIDNSLKRRILRWGYQNIRKVIMLFSRSTDAFIINSYLSINEVISLQLRLKQIPQLWLSPKLNLTVKPDHVLRAKLKKELSNYAAGNGMVSVAFYSLFFELIPICYLEGFRSLDKQVEQLKWPSDPKFIFTSNNFDTDEIFKLWTGYKTENGIKYYIGQHGNSYGTSRYAQNSVEEIIADKFITWGWKDELPQQTPAFIFKNAPLENKAGRKLLNLQSIYYQHSDTWDTSAEWNNYFEDQKKFLDLLHQEIKDETVIRLHYSYAVTKKSEPELFAEYDKSLTIDIGSVSFGQSVSQSRLLVFSSDSTGILETFAQNIPTIAFWQNGLGHVRETAKPYYQILIDAGIIHLSPESAACKINEIWNDVNAWWFSETVQEARIQFCNKYARISHKRIEEILAILQ